MATQRKNVKLGQKAENPQEATDIRTAATKRYSMEEVSKHNTQESCWMVMHGFVYDVTKFLSPGGHPGGPEILMQSGGKDATNEFEEIFHSLEARVQSAEYVIGRVEGDETDIDQIMVSASQSSDNSSLYIIPLLILLFVVVAYMF